MNDLETKLEKYAALAVEVGVNVQPGQTLVVNAPLITAPFVRKVVKRAYEKGAKNVHVDWSDEDVTRIKFELAPDEAFLEFPMWRAKGFEELAAGGAAYLYIDASNPDLLKGIDPQRIQNWRRTASAAMRPFNNYTMADKISWSIVAHPSQLWADKVFPALPAEERVDALWSAIFQATRIQEDDPVQAWKEHSRNLEAHAKRLNERKYKSLHYTTPGTDLTVELPKGHHWVAAESVNEKGIPFMANMPTEEVFTAPLKTGVNGTVRSTKPLSYAGNLIENFSLTFKDGRIVDFTADKGLDTLQRLIETDDGSHYLGEVALVPHESPISNSNLIFYSTLFDENASNHFAIGKAYPFTLEGGKNMSEDEVKAHGLNDSLTHVDFMVGSGEMDIDGILENGDAEPVFRKGKWAF